MVLPPKRGSDGSYSSFSSSSSRGVETRHYLDPWDLENALYIRGKRISFASDPNTFSAASAALGDKPVTEPSVDTGFRAIAGSLSDYKVGPYGYKQMGSSCVDSGYCNCEYETPSYVDPSILHSDPLPSMHYLSVCPYCHTNDQPQMTSTEQPKSLPYISTSSSNNNNNNNNNNNTGEQSLDSCEECSVCSSVAPPPPLLLFSGRAGLSMGECRECQQQRPKPPSFSPSPRHASVPTRPSILEPVDELAYVYESPRMRAKHSLPSVWTSRDTVASNTRWNAGDRIRRMSLAALPTSMGCYDFSGVSRRDTSDSLVEPTQGPHAPLLAPPRHPCRWGMARSGHISIDYSNAWMSLARRIRPSRS